MSDIVTNLDGLARLYEVRIALTKEIDAIRRPESSWLEGRLNNQLEELDATIRSAS